MSTNVNLLSARRTRESPISQDNVMTDSIMYHDGNRQLQDRFDSRRISDRLEQKLTRTQFTADDKSFIESMPYFSLRRQTPVEGLIAHSKAALLVSCASPGHQNSHFPITTEMACSKVSAIS